MKGDLPPPANRNIITSRSETDAHQLTVAVSAAVSSDAFFFSEILANF